MQCSGISYFRVGIPSLSLGRGIRKYFEGHQIKRHKNLSSWLLNFLLQCEIENSEDFARMQNGNSAKY